MRKLLTTVSAVGLIGILGTPANAVLLNANGTGINYTLTETDTANPLTDRFVLSITGINAATDTEGGREGVNAFALTPPTGFTTAVMIIPATGFTLNPGGLNSTGCDGSGNFFCFDNINIPNASGNPGLPLLATNSSLSFTFDVTTTTGNFTGYNPSFKIDWVGTQNNYDLISTEIGITDGGGNPPPPPPPPQPVPEPASLAIFGSALAGLGLFNWLRRRPDNITSAA